MGAPVAPAERDQGPATRIRGLVKGCVPRPTQVGWIAAQAGRYLGVPPLGLTGFKPAHSETEAYGLGCQFVNRSQRLLAKPTFGKIGASVRSIVAMNSVGRVTLPAGVRRELNLEGEGFFEVEIQKGAIVLKPVAVVPLDQAKAHLPDYRRAS